MEEQKVYIFTSGDYGKKKEGLVSVNGTIICAPKYDSLKRTVSDLCYCAESKNCYTYYNLADENAKPVDIPMENLRGGIDDHEHFYHDGLLLVKDPSTQLYGFLNWNNELVIPYIYKSSCGFSEGVAFVEREDGTAGFIDTEGNEVLPFKYKKTSTGGIYTGGVAGVSYDGEKMLIIDRQGNELTPANYSTVKILREGLLLLTNEHQQYGVANKKGEIIPCEYIRIQQWGKDTLQLVKEFYSEEYNQKLPVQGMADFEGNIVVPCEYEEVQTALAAGYMRVQKRIDKSTRKWGVMKDGKVIVPFEYKRISDVSEKDAIVGYFKCEIDSDHQGVFRDDKQIVPAEYWIKDCSYGLTLAQKDDLWTLFDNEGNVIGEAGAYDKYYFDYGNNFQYVLVSKGNQWGVIDRKGTVVTPLTDDKEWDSIGIHHGCIFKNYQDGKGVITDMKGKILFEHDKVSVIEAISTCDVIRYDCGEYTGFVKSTGEELVPCEISEFSTIGKKYTYLDVEKDSLHGLLDATGKAILPIEFGEVVCVDDADIVVAKSGRKWVAFNQAGEPLLKEEPKKAKKKSAKA